MPDHEGSGPTTLSTVGVSAAPEIFLQKGLTGSWEHVNLRLVDSACPTSPLESRDAGKPPGGFTGSALRE